jgi:PAS domain S-box-containing protein
MGDILIVGSMQSQFASLADWLRAAGHEVRHAASGEEALAILLATPPDLVLVPQRLPGSSGAALCRQLKALAGVATVPVVLLLETADLDERQAGFQAGASDCLVPPLMAQEVLARINSQIRLVHASRDLAALRDSQSFYQSLSQASPVGIFRTDEQGVCVFVNERWCQITGLTPEQAVGDRWIRSLMEADRTPVEVGWGQTLKKQIPFDLEYRFVRPDGATCWVHGQAVPARDEAGAVVGYIGTLTDINERKLVDAKLSGLNQQLQALFDAAVEVAIIATDPQGRITLYNSGAQRMLGYTPQEIRGQSIAMLHRPGDLAACARELTQQLGRPVVDIQVFVEFTRNGRSDIRNWIYMRKDGRGVQVSLALSAVRNADGKVTGFLGMARDITEHMAAQESLMQLNTQLDSRVNERTRALQQSSQQLQAALDDLRRTQAQLVQSEKLAGLGSIVAAVAHELNTPIGNCVTVASALQDKTDSFGQQVAGGALRRSQLEDYLESAREGMQLLMRGLQRTHDLVSNFKRVAVDQSGSQRRQFDLKQAVGDVVALMLPTLRTTPHQLNMEVPAGLMMDSFPGAVEQIVNNLVNNSLLHGFAGRAQGVMLLSAQRQGDRLRLDYRDDGVGMSPEVLRHIFDPFFTTALGKGGSGLGMSICYNLITGPLGGSIEVASVPGQGSSFTIVLPCIAP